MRKSYNSDLTNKEWELIQPLIPPAKSGGHPRTVDIREILNGIFYVMRTGCAWGMMPHDLPPSSTVYFYFRRWQKKTSMGENKSDSTAKFKRKRRSISYCLVPL